MRNRTFLVFSVLFAVVVSPRLLFAQAPPRIDSVVMDEFQPHQTSSATIWYDDFSADRLYGEQSGVNNATVVNGRDTVTGYGGQGGSLLAYYPEGVPNGGIGNRKVFFGDSPVYPQRTQRPGEKFEDVYWRFYLKHEHGWTGGSPAKMARATSLATTNWAQGMIAHVWDGGQYVWIDPATGIDVATGQRKSTKYNDFDNLDWMGGGLADFPIHATDESGYWVSVEARARLNTPGLSDGIFQLWIDGRLSAELTNLNWHGTWDEKGINAIFLEAFWNSGSPVDQSRWFDNFVISTERIGAIYAPRNPVVIRSVAPGDSPGTWQVRAALGEGEEIIWISNQISGDDYVVIDHLNGAFQGSLTGLTGLDEGLYYLQIRELSGGSSWTDWSHWHQPFNVAIPEPAAAALLLLGGLSLLARPRRGHG